MTTPIGVNGGIAVVAEATYGTDPGSGYVIQHGIDGCTLNFKRRYIENRRISVGATTSVGELPPEVGGDVPVHFTYEEDTIGVFLKNFGAYSAPNYTIGGTSAKTTSSLCIHVNYGGLDHAYTGCVGTSFKLELPADGGAVFTPTFVCQNAAVDASGPTYTLPTESQILMPSSYGALTVGGTACLFRGMSIDVDLPNTGMNRAAAGGSLIKQPLPAGRASIKGSIEFELDDATGENTIALLAAWLTSGTVGAVVLGSSITLSACKFMGNMPAWQAGVQTFTLEFVNYGTMTIVTS